MGNPSTTAQRWPALLAAAVYELPQVLKPQQRSAAASGPGRGESDRREQLKRAAKRDLPEVATEVGRGQPLCPRLAVASVPARGCRV